MSRSISFPELEPRKIADEVEGTCAVTFFTEIGQIWVDIRLKRSMRDRDIDLEELRSGLWIGFDGEPPSWGRKILNANVTQMTLSLRIAPRADDRKRLHDRFRMRIAPKPKPYGPVGGVLLSIERYDLIEPTDSENDVLS